MAAETKLTQSELDLFTGTEHWYQHGLVRHITYTDGAKYLAERAGAYWLLDIIASTQLIAKVHAEDFQVWELLVKEDQSATVTCHDGNGHNVYTQDIRFTDFPLAKVALWFENNVIYLPTER